MVHHIYEKYVNELAKDAINDTINVNDTIKNDTIKNDTIKNDTIKNDTTIKIKLIKNKQNKI